MRDFQHCIPKVHFYYRVGHHIYKFVPYILNSQLKCKVITDTLIMQINQSAAAIHLTRSLPLYKNRKRRKTKKTIPIPVQRGIFSNSGFRIGFASSIIPTCSPYRVNITSKTVRQIIMIIIWLRLFAFISTPIIVYVAVFIIELIQ